MCNDPCPRCGCYSCACARSYDGRRDLEDMARGLAPFGGHRPSYDEERAAQCRLDEYNGEERRREERREDERREEEAAERRRLDALHEQEEHDQYMAEQDAWQAQQGIEEPEPPAQDQ